MSWKLKLSLESPRGSVRQLLTSVAKMDPSAALETIQQAVSENFMDARTLAKLLIHRMRVVLLLRYAPALCRILLA